MGRETIQANIKSLPVIEAASSPPTQRVLFIAALVAINTCSSIDRVATITMGPAIKQDLRLSDFQFGLIAGFGFALFYAFLGLPIARFADTHNRVKLIAFAVSVWSIFLMLSGFVRNFVHLMICRIAVGIGEAGVQPPSVSLVSDFYPPERRGFAIGLLALGVPVGTLVGAVGGGYLTELLSWRSAFIIIGTPGLVLAAFVWLLLRDPPRGMSERNSLPEDVDTTPTLLAVARHLGSKRSFWHLLAAIGLTNITVNGLGAFLPQYFSRVSHLNLGRVGIVYGSIGACATLVSFVCGGAVVDWISRRDGRWYVWLSAAGCLLSAPLYILSFVTVNSVWATILLTFASICIFLYYTPTQVVLQNMAQPRMRATVAFVFFLVVGLVGVGLGPTLVGLLSDEFASHSFGLGDYASRCPGGVARALTAGLSDGCRVASSVGLQRAMMGVACVAVWAALHFLLAARTIRKDMNETFVGPAGKGRFG
jgi:predicted MFS family arabinose efflux permease